MASSKIVDALRQVAIFQDLQPAQLTELARHSERIKFAPGETITRAGEAGNGAYLLVSGVAVRVPEPGSGEEREGVEPGSIIGQSAMLIEHAYGSTVEAQERVFCLKITRAGLLAQIAADASLAQHIAQHVAHQLLAVARQLREIDSLLQARRLGLSAEPPLALSPPAQATLGTAVSPR
jgi:CRP-like cAMP-binding protein